MSIINRLNSGISYLETQGLYTIANTLYLAKEALKDKEVLEVNQNQSTIDYFGIYGRIAVNAGHDLNYDVVDYTQP